MAALRSLQLLYAAVVRSGGNPNHGRDGKFSSGGGGGTRPMPTFTPAQKWDILNEAFPPGVRISRDGRSQRLLNGPWKGRKIPFEYKSADTAGRLISDSIPDERNFWKYVAPSMLRRLIAKGATPREARLKAKAWYRAVIARIDPPPQVEGIIGTFPPRPDDAARFTEAARIVRMLHAVAERASKPLHGDGGLLYIG